MNIKQERRARRGPTAQFVTFHVGPLFFGIDALRVQEVLRQHEMTPIPLAPDAIRGLINLRGQIVTAVDTRGPLGLAPAPAGTAPMNVIFRSEDGPVSLLVDEIGDVQEVQTASYAPIPENVPSPQRDLLWGVYRLSDRLMLLLNTEKLLETACH